MRAAHDHVSTLQPETPGQLISMIGARRVESDSNHIRAGLPMESTHKFSIDLLRLFIHMPHLPAGRHPGAQIRHGNLLEIKHPRFPDLADLW